ncbi:MULTISPECIES: CinA family protein [Streptomyces]|uniref:Nicotinamide-nucleotide amidohydrolase family protein n=1 Tax=Streptomyces koelreuteriae TaxID=2838015 RepID=A0ABX8FND5_9ACTN|nr:MULTISPECIES: CinA family protein [Streptomyces]QWB22557.1 nicotinamide-nucleotide amidohydrolase family protein [Streptomyces koelreuteriae]UUA05505.1 CinA family protein [Streptomyces koelreuteriae]UUA13132.1 CinA family protein [Streptomyces sp. CRCS-T-1]
MSLEDIAARLGSLLRAGGLSVSTAESLTGGLLGATITSTPGASDYYRGGAITYATDSKATVLSVSETTLASDGPVSPATAEQMAHGVRELFGSSFGISTTGVAGPTGQDGKPVGLVHIGISDTGRTVSHEFNSTGTTRDEVRRQAVERALSLLVDHLNRSEGS